MPPAPGESLVHARGLTKRFGDFTAVNAVDFDVLAGEAFGFLGPNGAGKTSTMRMIACASPITAGELTVIGMDPRTQATEIKARLGVVPQLDNLDTELSVRENLEMYARYFDIPDAIARSLINEPELIMADEPTTGLDPQARHLLWERLYRLKQRGATLIITTHYMDEAEQLCDRLVVMDGGRIVAEGSPRELVATHATREVVELRFGRASE